MKTKEKVLSVKVTLEDYGNLCIEAASNGFKNISELSRHKILDNLVPVNVDELKAEIKKLRDENKKFDYQSLEKNVFSIKTELNEMTERVIYLACILNNLNYLDKVLISLAEHKNHDFVKFLDGNRRKIRKPMTKEELKWLK